MPLLVAARHNPHCVTSTDHHHNLHRVSSANLVLPEPLDFTMSKFKASTTLFPGYLHDDKGEFLVSCLIKSSETANQPQDNNWPKTRARTRRQLFESVSERLQDIDQRCQSATCQPTTLE